MNWVILETSDYREKIYVNIDNIAYIYFDSRTIIMCGNTGQGNGILNITQESLDGLIAIIERIRP